MLEICYMSASSVQKQDLLLKQVLKQSKAEYLFMNVRYICV